MTDLLYTSKSFVPEYPLKEADVCFMGIPFDQLIRVGYAKVSKQVHRPAHRLYLEQSAVTTVLQTVSRCPAELTLIPPTEKASITGLTITLLR